MSAATAPDLPTSRLTIVNNGGFCPRVSDFKIDLTIAIDAVFVMRKG